ncbi:MAG: outer membrane beta-barrel protein [Gemmatimonadetes bacterium]|nr:outer membrane beta-barrel protein [Gemmatimonadota bacterium]MYG15998.1 outer membrane beta-barrel protein [Gemmatimonadota bacterium]
MPYMTKTYRYRNSLDAIYDRSRLAKSMRAVIFVAALVAALALLAGTAMEVRGQASMGRISGTVVDAETGDPLIGATVVVVGLELGAMADLEGTYLIRNVPAGLHAVQVSMIGYAAKRITEIQVEPDQVSRIDITVEQELIVADVVEVTARSLENTEASLLKQRQNALSISDAISAEDISRGAQGDVAAAMTRVTGASVVDGKYVYIRGLGERYSTAQLNGTSLPNADPNSKSVQMDIFAANLLDNITTEKTFTPDKPGNFTGGSVNVKTKSLPESFTMSFSSSTKYNTQSSFKDMLSYEGGEYDFLGFDDGTRDIPLPLRNPDVEIPSITSALRDPEAAQLLDLYSRSFTDKSMTPTTIEGGLGQSYAFSIGNQTEIAERPFGMLGSVSYNRNISAYDNGASGIWKRVSREAEGLNRERFATDMSGSEEVLWGGLVNATYQPSITHEIGVNVLYNRSGEKLSRFQTGAWPSSLPGENVRYETRVLSFIEREMRSLQFRGKHVMPSVSNMEIEWTGAFIRSNQDEPDLRYFTNEFQTVDAAGEGVPDIDSYTIALSNYAAPTRYFRNLEESNRDFKLDVTLPFTPWSGLTARMKFGGAYLDKNHTFRERRFSFRQDALQYRNDPVVFFSTARTGILPDEYQDTPGFTRFGNFVSEDSDLRNNYDGDQEIRAGYVMLDLPLTRRFKVTGGARYESTLLDVASHETSLTPGRLDEKDWLPSINTVYQVVDNMNVRGAYSRTLARPSFRELAPFASFLFVGDYIFVGNSDLKRTLIDNYDFRWEWFNRPGEIYALSYFYKKFENPIERVIVTTNGEIQFQNVDRALVSGLELEFRKQLDQLHPSLGNFQLGGNLSLISSQVDIAPSELAIIRALDPGAGETRKLQGQSPYVVNIDAMYDNPDTGTLVSVHYNVFGERLSEVSTGGTPNAFEQPAGMLDITGSQRLWDRVTLKFSAKNLLDPDIKKVHPFNNEEYIRSLYKRGRTFSLGFSYGI